MLQPLAVIDLCGNEPDPARVPETDVTRSGEFITFKLNWAKGDGRLFYVDYTAKALPASIKTARQLRRNLPVVMQTHGMIFVQFTGSENNFVKMWNLDGKLVYEKNMHGAAIVLIPQEQLEAGAFLQAKFSPWT